jgi:hypothetical protein
MLLNLCTYLKITYEQQQKNISLIINNNYIYNFIKAKGL